ncbi:MAG: hypothetical protein AAGG51_02870 [Cyanobacteria bacterium P01_G01_bin.54]
MASLSGAADDADDRGFEAGGHLGVTMYYRFQLCTFNEVDAQRFCEEIKAMDVVIEDWTAAFVTPDTDFGDVYTFAVTDLSPKQLSRIADLRQVALVYMELYESAEW